MVHPRLFPWSAILGATLVVAAPASTARIAWETLAPGMELAEVQTSRRSSHGGSKVTVLRIDPARWQLTVVGISETGEKSGRTARQWSQAHGFSAAINAGMFATDYKTHVGYQRAGKHVNNGHFNDYQSIAAFGRRTENVPHFRIFDVDSPGFDRDAILRDYSSVVQNLRLIKRPGENRWAQQERRWSEAALGEDAAGRILFLFCRSPFSMYELNHELLGMGIDLVAAQHLEGGPEAQLFVAVGDREIERVGSFETLFREDNGNQNAWSVPNILGVRPRSAGAERAGPP